MLREIFAVLISFALCAVLMAGCASAAGNGNAGAVSAPSPAVTAAAAPEAAPEEDAPDGAGSLAEPQEYDESDLKDALDAAIAYEAGTAGSSLKTAIAAAGLVEFFATQCTPEDAVGIMTDTADWYADLTAGQQATLAENWPSIYAQAEKIVEDPAGQAELLSEAGVTTDFTKLDLVAPAEAMVALDSVLGQQK